MHNIINLHMQRITYFIPSEDVFCYCHFLKDVKFVLTAVCYVTVFNIVVFSSRHGMTCTLNDSAWKFQRWRYYRL